MSIGPRMRAALHSERAARADAPAESADVGQPLVAELGVTFTPESVRLLPGASRVARIAVARMIAAHVRGVYVTEYMFVPTYEVWYWLGAVIAAPTSCVDYVPRRGRQRDWRREPGGFGAFVLVMTGIDRNDCGLSYDQLADLIYAAETDWCPFAPVTSAQLRECGWTEDSRFGGRTRLKEALRVAANSEARSQGVKRSRGGRRT